jgi:hypothetical protein
MDKLGWFKFSPSSYMMGRIQRCSEIAQSRFIRLCCVYWNHNCEMLVEDAKLEVETSCFNELIKNSVLYSDDEYVFIRFLDDQYSEIEKTSNKGKLYALKRWNPDEYNKVMGIATEKEPINTPMGTHSHPNAEEKRREKRREDKKRKKFIPPSLNEVTDYFHKNGYSKEAGKKAFEYYDCAGWKDSKGNDVKSWKQKMRGVWFKDEYKQVKTQSNNAHLFMT